ncbi:hypothetical protein [Pseudomonas chlororaphis]|uniref:hypothetical protein n=1 Tax=Pseudomonas chlororaphis TaxID=587753 RepID=UPI000F58D6F6|nr:hypothetical protein [Pseudomonas chlororaphis]QIT23523.1 hypothetical protein HCN09_17915 [Pseudomonas chlororaphis subsp. aurantiaca]WDH01616.1 hypothetical protein PUP57_19040 [Pseudomonas chlororaphis]WDH09536.1 hypothetical protein PUP64_27970 [Pseudomonas chlororaphis]
MAATHSISNTTNLTTNLSVESTYNASADSSNKNTAIVFSLFGLTSTTANLTLENPGFEPVKGAGSVTITNGSVRLLAQKDYFTIVFNGTVKDGTEKDVTYIDQIIATFSSN